MIRPVIKWSGSKRKFASEISRWIPEQGVYFEPFVGGGAILGTIGPRKGFAGDIIPELIDLWKFIKSDPKSLAQNYESHWKKLQAQGHTYYYEVRANFNLNRTPGELLFLSRTCVNGLIRFNREGNFNNSLHHTRPGIHPDSLRIIIQDWSRRIADTDFFATDFLELTSSAKKGDVVYLDPPYMGTKGRYQNVSFDFDRLWSCLEDLNRRNVKWILSLDGSSGSRDYSKELEVPLLLSKQSFLLDGESSPFPRLLNQRQDLVKESMFLNFDLKK